MTRRSGAVVGLAMGVLLATPAILTGPASMAAPAPSRAVRSQEPGPLPPEIMAGKPLPLEALVAAQRRKLETAESDQASSSSVTKVGDTRLWPSLNAVESTLYLKEYTLRGIGKHIEMWVATGSDEVASGLSFRKGDCRNGPRTQVTDAQISRFIREFEDTIFPTSSRVFSMPQDRDGNEAAGDGENDIPPGYWQGTGDRIVTLIDNVRDENFNNIKNQTYVAGFFSRDITERVDRNVMTLDGFDWLHRTGDSPPNDPSDDPCVSAPARPNAYEGTFAHEYQHLLHNDVDADETVWLNEGLSEYAQTLTGYANPATPIRQTGFEGGMQCFLGWLAVKTDANPNPRVACGPENSLTNWAEQGAEETLADYGAVNSFVMYLVSRFGADVATDLHRGKSNGLEAVQEMLDDRAPGLRAMDVLRNWVAMNALDGILDDGAQLSHGLPGIYTSRHLHQTINWDNPHTHNAPGAPPNGADFVRLRAKDGSYLAAHQIRSITFEGTPTLPSRSLEWAVDKDARPDNPALASGTGDGLDRSLVRSVTVPDEDPTLTFDTKYHTEPGWDFAVVQVSRDGGKTYQSVANAATTSKHDPGADTRITDQLPGLTGDSQGWKTQRFDLSAYAGRDVILSFRHLTDAANSEAGFWVDNIKVGSKLLSDGSSLSGFRTASQAAPIPVQDWTVQLVGYGSDGKHAYVGALPLRSDFAGSLNETMIRRMLGDSDVVAALVMQDDPTETSQQQARYRLVVNGARQPGG